MVVEWSGTSERNGISIEGSSRLLMEFDHFCLAGCCTAQLGLSQFFRHSVLSALGVSILNSQRYQLVLEASAPKDTRMKNLPK